MKDLGELKDKLRRINKLVNKKQANKSIDFNFFYPYTGRKKEIKYKKIHFISIAVTISLIFIGGFIGNYIIIRNLENKIEKHKVVLDSPKTKENEKIFKDLSNRQKLLMEYYDLVDKLNMDIQKRYPLNGDLMGKISSTIPKNISFKTMNMKDLTIDIQGVADSRVEIAEFEHNLNGLNRFQEVKVDKITKNLSNTSSSTVGQAIENEMGKYSFTIKCTLKDVDLDENK